MEKTKVLIVEDDAVIAMHIESQLKQFGYSVSATVGYGEQVIEKVKENTPDVVLMDIVLKGEMDGIEAAKEIHTQFDIPVIFLTAFADKDRLERAKLTYPFGFILKPFQNKDLKVTIEMALYISKADAERKQAEEDLKKSEEKYRTLFEVGSDALLLIDEVTGNLLEANEAACKLYGYSHEELVGLKAWDLSAEPEKTKKAIKLVEKTFLPIRDHKNKDGTVFPVEINTNDFTLDGRKITFSAIRDITERKRAEEKLEKKTRLSTTLLDVLPCVALLLRPETREIVFSNKAGREVGAVPGTTCYGTWGQSDHPCQWCLAPRAWASDKPQHLVVEAGGTVWDAYWYPIDEDLYLHYAFDITEKSKMEK